MHRLAAALRMTFMLLVVAFVMAPLIIVVLVSFSPTPVFDLPTQGLSLQWYRKLAMLDGLWPAIRLSFQLAAVATLAALLLGTLCALALLRGRFHGRNALLTFVLSPLMLPGVVIGIAMLFAFRGIGLHDSYVSLMIAHVVVTLPYVVRIVHASLSLFDYAMIDAARTLGYTHAGAILRVLVPNIFPSFLTAGMFAFIASLDNYALALFLGDVRNFTLPVQILRYIEYATDPSIAAISTVMVLLTIAILLVGERLVGIRRMAGQ